MRSCLPVILVVIILGGVEYWAATFFVSQMEFGFCSDDALRIALGLAVGAIATLALGTILVYMLNEILLKNSLSGGQVVFASAGLMLVVMAGITGYALYASGQSCPSLTSISSRASTVCQGQGVLEAADWRTVNLEAATDQAVNLMSLNNMAHIENQSPYHLVVLGDDGGQVVWTVEARQEWQPATLNDLEFVVCVSPIQTIPLPACQGDFLAIQRDQEQATLRLVNASTAETILAGQILGKAPDCPDSGISLARRLTGKITYADIKSWVNESLEKAPTTPLSNTAQPTAIRSIFIAATPQPTATLIPVPTALPKGTSTGLVRVRAGPGKDQAIIGGLVTGEVVEVFGANPDRTWLKVRTDKDVTGWVFGELIKLQVPIEELAIVD